MEQILNAILLYSLGLGLVLALLTGLTLVLTRSASPLLRYRILVGLLGLFTAGVAITAFLKLGAVDPGNEGTAQVLVQQHTPLARQAAISPAATLNLIVLGKDFMEQHARSITLVWLFIVLFKCIKLGSNLFELHYLKTRQIYPAGKHWEDEVLRLGRKIGLNKTVRVLQSGVTQVPLVIGHFKPVILIPLGMITAIKPAEIEMMLLHELAHIKRLDFLVNILQHVLELLFFFNPAVLWVSSLIRRERENCCDEMVLQNSGEKQSYIQALLSFREYQLNVPAYAMALAKESNLITRVKRMVYQKNTALSSIEKGCLLVVVVLICSFGVLRSASATDLKAISLQDTVIKKGKTTVKPIVPAQKATKTAVVKPKPAVVPVKGTTVAPSVTAEAGVDAAAESDPGVSVSINSNANNNTSTSVSLNIDHKAVQNLAVKLGNTVIGAINMALDSSAQVSYTANILADPQPKAGAQPRLNVQSRLAPLQKTELKESGLTEQLLRALEKAGIQTKGENFTFRITNKELSVNGKKQPDEILGIVLKDFLKSPEDSIDFSYNRNNKGVNTSSSYYRK